MMGGSIGVDTSLGIGSRFYFTIQTALVNRPSSLDRWRLPIANKRILVIDSSPTTGEMLRLQAESLEITAFTATDVVQGLRFIVTQPAFDLALLNWKIIMDDPDYWQQKIQNTAREQGYYLPILPILDTVDLSFTPDSSPRNNALSSPKNSLVKPIKRSHFVEQLIEVWSRPVPEWINLPPSSSSPSPIADPDPALDSNAEPLIVPLESSPPSSDPALNPELDPELDPEHLSPSFATHYPWRILLAEDNPVNQMVAIAMLKRLGYTVDVANNGLEVLALLNQKIYDVILMDLQMPELDGATTAQRICQTVPPEQQPWMIAMTANVMQGIIQECSASGLKDYISKPVQLPILAAALRRVLR